MTCINIALAAILAPVAFAIPQAGYGGYGGYGHHGHAHPSHGPHRPSGFPTGGPVPVPSGVSGTGLSPIGSTSAPYGFGNSTGVGGPTGTGTGAVPPKTVTVIPLPVSSSVGGEKTGGSGGSGNSPTGLSSAGGQCGPATVTVTSANTVTVTVPAVPVSSPQESSPISASSAQSAPYPIGNNTSVIGSTGTVGTIGSGSPMPTAPGLPVYSGLPQSSISSIVVGSTAAPVESSSISSPAPVQSSSSSAAVVIPYQTPSSSSVPGGAFYTQSTASASTAEALPATSTPASFSSSIPISTPTSTPTYSASTSSSAPTQTSSPSTSGGDVVARGLVYNTAALTSLFEGSTIGWCYNWDSSPDGTIPSSMNYVPMLWNTSNYHVPNWKSNVDTAISNGATHILGFNEPDLSAQANMSPQEAANAWTNMEQFGSKVKIGSPAVCNGGGATGLNWLTDFMGKCSGCQIDFIAIHWYGLATDDGVADLKKHIGDTQAMAGGRPIWLTEFEPSGSSEDQQSFMSQMLPWLDDKSNGVERYAYYEVDGILASGSSKTPLGDAYTA